MTTTRHLRQTLRWCSAFQACLLIAFAVSAKAETFVDVRCKPHHGLVSTPVMMPVPKDIKLPTGDFVLVEEGTARRIPVQIVAEPSVVMCFMMPPRAPSEITRRFRVTADAPEPSGLAFDDSDKDRILIREGDRPVATFVRGAILKDGVPPRYRRSCYIHPVHDLDGTVLTDDFPRDHFHHRGLFWAWPRVEAAGKHYDQWSVGEIGHRHKKVLSRQAGPVCAVLRVANDWVAAGRTLVEETVELCFWRTGPEGRAIDVYLTFAAVDGPVVIGGEIEYKKGYGGFSVRFAPRRGTTVMGPEGLLADHVDNVAMTWSDLSGRFTQGSDTISGLAIFDAPCNPGFPQKWTNRSYGFLNPAWPGQEKTEIKPGEPLRLRYRVWVHRYEVSRGKVIQAQQNFVDPPDARCVVSGSTPPAEPAR